MAVFVGKVFVSLRKETVQCGERSSSEAETVQALRTELNQTCCEMARLQRELEALRARAADGAAAQTTLQEVNRALQEHTLRVEQQMAVAQRFQNLFNPPVLPRMEGVNFTVKYQPCARVGGDLYDVFDMGNSCVGILVADISGEGLAATLVTAVAKMAFDTFRQNEYSPKAILEKVNTHVVRHTLGSQFLTVFLGVLDLETMKMKYVNAANPRPLLYGPKRFEFLDTDGLCCGMFDDPHYEEKETQLKPGDRILSYTNGLPDMYDMRGELCWNTRIYDLAQECGELPVGEMVGRIMADFDVRLAGAEQNEDLTVVGFELVAHETKPQQIVIPSEPKLLNRVENRIIEQLKALNYGERTLFGVRLAVEEAVINAIKHGNKMDKTKNVTITYSVNDKECVISVADEGDGFNPQVVPDPTADENLELPHGRGLVLMRAYMDEVKYNEKGDCVTMRKKAPWAE